VTNSPAREYAVEAQSTDVFGRVMCRARDHFVVVDGPVHNGCPGVAAGPVELVLMGLAACAVELLQVIAGETKVTVGRIGASARAMVDRSLPQPHANVTVFTSVLLDLRIGGTDGASAAALVEGFKRR
jgi:uncharacterized OsmC-like protein